MVQQKLFWKLEALKSNDLLIFPSSRSSSRIDVRRIIVGTELGWVVTFDGKPLLNKDKMDAEDRESMRILTDRLAKYNTLFDIEDYEKEIVNIARNPR